MLQMAISKQVMYVDGLIVSIYAICCKAAIHKANSWPLDLRQYWVIVNWTLRNKLKWHLNQNTKLFIHVNAFENAVCEVAAILDREGLNRN